MPFNKNILENHGKEFKYRDSKMYCTDTLLLKHNDDTMLSFMKLQKSYVMVNSGSFSDTRNTVNQEIFYIV